MIPFLKNICVRRILVEACGIFNCGMGTLSYGMWDLVR